MGPANAPLCQNGGHRHAQVEGEIMLHFVARCASVLLFLTTAAIAQNVPVYTDGFLPGFDGNSSYGGGYGFNNPAPFHNGSPSIAFTGNATFNAISFYHSG